MKLLVLLSLLCAVAVMADEDPLGGLLGGLPLVGGLLGGGGGGLPVVGGLLDGAGGGPLNIIKPLLELILKLVQAVILLLGGLPIIGGVTGILGGTTPSGGK